MTKRTMNQSRRRIAQISTSAIEVVCPLCGECQPNPDDGSHLWLRSQLLGAEAKRDCVACNAPLLIIPRLTAQVA